MNIEKVTYLDKINFPAFKAFTKDALEAHGTDKKAKVANKVADAVYQKFINQGLIQEGVAHQTFVDIVLSAALLHNLFVKDNDEASILYHRRELKGLVEIHGISNEVQYIYRAIEGQYGEFSPVEKLKPTVGTPEQALADAIFYITKFKPTV